jgi:hypothetical protein
MRVKPVHLCLFYLVLLTFFILFIAVCGGKLVMT